MLHLSLCIDNLIYNNALCFYLTYVHFADNTSVPLLFNRGLLLITDIFTVFGTFILVNQTTFSTTPLLLQLPDKAPSMKALYVVGISLINS